MKSSFSTIAVLGATGSIGTQTLDVARRSGIRVTSLSAQNNVRALAALCREFRPQSACIAEEHYAELRLMEIDSALQSSIVALKVGQAGRTWIPPEMLYGERNIEGIEPNSIIVYDIALHDIL